ncbi:MAG: AAA domain-containing protein, partial [Polyangiaceae bacterium]
CDDSDQNVRETSHEAYRLTEEATGRYDWALDLTHLTLGNFNYRKMSLVRDYDALAKRPDDAALPAFERLFSLDARDVAQPPSGSTEPLAPYVVVPADPTQTAALHWARAGSDFIIQGPPGTGKSQTITNLIADFAGQGKRVLFVCEKRAALDVVFARLAKLGLDEVALLIHDSQTDKRGFIAELAATYERHVASLEQPKPDRQSERSGVLQRMDEPLEALRAFASSMLQPAEGTSASVAELLVQRLELGDVEALAPEVEELLPDHGVWQSGREAVLELARALQEVGESRLLFELPLVRVARSVLDHDRPVNELRDRVLEVRKALDRVRQVGASLALENAGPTIDELRQAVALAESLAELARHGGLELLDTASEASQALDDSQRLHTERTRALTKAQEATRSWRNKLPASDVGPALEQARRLQTVFILFLLFMPVWWRLRRVLREGYDFGAHQIAPTWTAILEALAQEYERAKELEEVEIGVRERFADATLSEIVNLTEHARSDANKTPLQLALRQRWANDPAAPLTELVGVGNALSALEEASARVFTDTGKSSVEELSELCESVSQASDLLPPLLAPLRALFDVDVSVRRAVMSVRLEPQHWDAAISSAALARTFRANRPLARFQHESLLRRCQQLDANYSEWLASNAEAVRAAVRERFQRHLKLSAQPKSALSTDEVQLKQAYTAGRRILEREFKKVMRHKSIRELSSGDTGTVLYDLKPVWLMSPLSISDTINPDEQRFDVVIFDEASQIPLEEAVPVVCRAPQMIVVGDEMQLPPTTFFAGRREIDEASQPAGYDLDAESFLTHAAQKLPSTMLGWHYRSRYEALIRFSNQAFYGGKLLTVPDRELSERREALVVEQVSDGASNASELLRRPISYHRLTCGVYAARRNLAEADYIAELIRGLLKTEPRQSIGVVAFSEAQQDAIEDALRRLAEQDGEFQSSLEAEYEREEDGQLVGLFVKNLENVQGDERDVIILSVCYGPDARGKMLMNFGPINKGGGEKRLNVVFSRAKRHMAVVASINYSAITNEYNEGANCLRRYLQYAEAVSVGDLEVARVASDALNTLGEPPPDDGRHPVVEQLAAELRRRGHTVEVNVGSSGFQVDLALSVQGRRVLAILVDTPRHYAVRNIMDSYHMRPSVLRSFGWSVEWVLSKDWYSEPDACVRRVETALDALNVDSSESGELPPDLGAPASGAG